MDDVTGGGVAAGPLRPVEASVDSVVVVELELEPALLSVYVVDVAKLCGDIAVPVPKEPSDGKMPAGIVVDGVAIWGDPAVPVPMEPSEGKIPLGILEAAAAAAASMLVALESSAVEDVELASCWG